MSDHFRARLAHAPATSKRREQTPARTRISETYDDITAAKNRGVTWQTIAELLNADGFAATDGTPLTGAQVSAMYSSEKTARGLRKKRRTKKVATQPVQTTRLAPAPDIEPARSAPTIKTPAEQPTETPPTDKPRSLADEKIAELEAKWAAKTRKLPRIM